MANARQNDFAANLRAERNRADLSQAELANAIGVSVASIQNWEDGEYMPSLSTTIRLADALGTSIDALAGRGA